MRKPIFLILIVTVIIGIAVLSNHLYQNKKESDETETITEVEVQVEPLSAADMVSSPEGYAAEGALKDSDLTVVDMVNYTIQYEYLAQGECELVLDTFGPKEKPYKQLLFQKEKQQAKLKEIYDLYSIDFPINDSKKYLFIPKTLLEAAQLGVEQETNSIAMYDAFLKEELPDAISVLFTKFRGSCETNLSKYQTRVDELS